ncbi:HlyD family secretion protein (plasmid) [Pseudomonas amygdali pv. lachrymans str. M301315]|nr:HlyD family secretion protein [Pseudomonas amygdali pv. lachrymans str. M301315]
MQVGRYLQSTDDAFLKADSTTVAPRVSGYVTEVLVNDNQYVEAGSVIAKLDARPYRAAYDQSLASVASKQASVEKIQASLTQQAQNIKQAQALVQSAKADADHAAHEYSRHAPLVARNIESGESLADLKKTRDSSAAELVADQAAAHSAQLQVSVLQADLAQAKADLLEAQANAEQARISLTDTEIQSPISGRVGDKSVRVGAYVQSGTRMLTLVPTNKIYAVANFKETQIGKMRIGQPVSVNVDALPGQPITGVIDSFSPGTGSDFALLPSQNATGNFTKIVQRVPVKIRLQVSREIQARLTSGMSIDVEVDTHELPEVSQAVAAQ